MWTRTSTCRQNGYGFTAPYPYEVTAGGAAAGELLGGVTGSRQILLTSDANRVGKGLIDFSERLRIPHEGVHTAGGILSRPTPRRS